MTEHTSELRLVRLGSSQADGQLEVVSGLSINDKIINNPPSGVASGWIPAQNAPILATPHPSTVIPTAITAPAPVPVAAVAPTIAPIAP